MNLFYILYNIVQMLGFILVMYVTKFVIFLKKDNKMLDFIKKSSYL